MTAALRRWLLCVMTVAACQGPGEESWAPPACPGKCDAADAAEDGWLAFASLSAAEQAVVRADLFETNTAVDLVRARWHTARTPGFILYWTLASPPPRFGATRAAMQAALAAALGTARERYQSLGFSVPDPVRVYVAEIDSEAAFANGGVWLGRDAIQLDFPRALVDAWQPDDPTGMVGATAAHELFHVAQYAAYAAQVRATGSTALPDWDASNLWIVEALAVQMEGALFPARPLWARQYAPWQQSLTLFGLGCAGVCKREWYQRVLFIRFLAQRGVLGDVHELWARLCAEADVTAPRGVVAFLDRHLGGRLFAEWARFAAAYDVAALRDPMTLPGIDELEVDVSLPELRPGTASGPVASAVRELWPLGGTRSTLLELEPAQLGRPLALRLAAGTGQAVRALVLDDAGAVLAELGGGETVVVTPQRPHLSVTLTSREPRATVLAGFVVEPRP